MSEEIVPQLAIMCGLPRSGKTTVARDLERHGYVRVCPDDIRLALHGQPFLPQAEPLVWAVAEFMARALLTGGRPVVIDACNVTAERRAPWVRMARDFGVTLDIFLVEASAETCIWREGGEALTLVIERMAHQYERPTCAEGSLMAHAPDTGTWFLHCDCTACQTGAAPTR